MELIAYKNYLTLIPTNAENKLEVVSTTNRVAQGTVQNSRIEGVDPGQKLYVSLDECVWIHNKLIVPESAILAFCGDE